MAIQTVTDAIRYVGVDDNTLALFENQYPVQPMGVSYNSYVILDEKIAVMDSVDARAAEEWLSNVAQVLEGRNPDYLVVTHMEPDHSGSLMRLAQKYPEMKIVGNAKTFTLIKQFFGTGALSEDRMLEVGERDTLSLGLHRLRFLLAPMVHWPEVMTAYEETEKILFSADASALWLTGTDCPCPLGAAGPTVLLQYYREIWRTGAGSAEKNLRAGDQNDLPAPWPHAHRRLGGVSAAL